LRGCAAGCANQRQRVAGRNRRGFDGAGKEIVAFLLYEFPGGEFRDDLFALNAVFEVLGLVSVPDVVGGAEVVDERFGALHVVRGHLQGEVNCLVLKAHAPADLIVPGKDGADESVELELLEIRVERIVVKSLDVEHGSHVEVSFQIGQQLPLKIVYWNSLISLPKSLVVGPSDRQVRGCGLDAPGIGVVFKQTSVFAGFNAMVTAFKFFAVLVH